MDLSSIIASGVTLIILILVGILIYYRNKQSKEGKQEARKFLNGLSDTLYNSFLDIIRDFNYQDYDNLVGIEIEIINRMEESAREYIKAELEKSPDLLSKLALKALSDEFINNFISLIINKIDIESRIHNQVGDRYQSLLETFESEDKDLEAQFSNEKEYYENESDVVLPTYDSTTDTLLESDDDGLEKRGFVLPNKKEEEQLNLPKDEEESFNPEDDSMEIIEEDTTSN